MNRQILAAFLLAGCLVPHVGNAQPAAPVRARVVIDPGPDGDQVNPTGRTFVLTAPLLDGETYIGDTTQRSSRAGRQASRQNACWRCWNRASHRSSSNGCAPGWPSRVR